CRFTEFEHVLYLSEIESALLLADAPPPVRQLDNGETCPWQDLHGLCSARLARPLGCRVYYCDSSYREIGEDLYERYLAEIRNLSGELGLPWNYQPLHDHLAVAVASGSFSDSPGPR